MAGDRPRRHRDDRRGAAAGAALPARPGRQAGCSTCSRPPTSTRPPGSSRRARRSTPSCCGSRATTGPAAGCSDRRTPKGKRPQGRGGAVRWATGAGSGSRAASTSSTGSTRAALLPAIVFIFSRVGCDAAVAAVPALGDPADDRRRSATRSSRSSRRRAPTCPTRTSHVLGYHDFLDGLTRGVAAHHAGMLPAFKQCVEQLFVRGLCKAVFATETLALGINMPARTVVLEKLSKWNGETHADITPGEYTQLTGRAGRRGLDVEGHAVVLWQPGMNPSEVAGLASTRTYPLRSSFRPSYNMAVNLVHQVGRRAGARAAGVVVRAVPGRQGGGRAGAAAAQERGRAGGVRRGRDLRPAATSWSTPRCASGVSELEKDAGPGPAGRPARGGARVAGAAAPRRRDRGARRQVRRVSPSSSTRAPSDRTGRGPTC